MSRIEFEDTQPLPRSYARSVPSKCSECAGDLVVLRVIGGRAGSEYWTMRCTHCGGIHLEIVGPHASIDGDSDGPLSAA
jgi:hypothetical protein